MAEKWIDGAALAAGIRQGVADAVKNLAAAGRGVHLTAILVGSTPAGELYAQRQREACETAGINYELRTLPADVDRATIETTLRTLNHDTSVTGIMLHLPLPAQLDTTALQYLIDPVKDVEGVNP